MIFLRIEKNQSLRKVLWFWAEIFWEIGFYMEVYFARVWAFEIRKWISKMPVSKSVIGVKKWWKNWKIEIFRVLKGIFAENSYMWSYKYIEECGDTRTSALRALHRWLGWQFTRCLEVCCEGVREKLAILWHEKNQSLRKVLWFRAEVKI